MDPIGPAFWSGHHNGITGVFRCYSYGMTRNGLVRVVIRDGDVLTFGWVPRESLMYPSGGVA